MIDFIQAVLSGIFLGGIYAGVATAFIVIFRGTRIFNFAQGEMVMLGGFLSWTILTYTSLPPWLAVIVAMAAAAGMGVLLERLAIRPLIGQPLFSIVMVTIALILCLRGITIIIWGAFPRRFPPIFGTRALELGPFIFSPSLFYGTIIISFMVLILWWMFNNTKRGLTMTATAEDHQIARALGISVKNSITIAWAIAGALSVIAAVSWLSGRSIGFLAAEIGLRALPCAMLAGFESISGALLAGIIVGVSESLAIIYLDELTGGGMSVVMPFLIMLCILLIRPEGMFGWKRIERL